MQKSKKKRTKKRAGTESLTVINLGNTVIIKDRSSPVIAISSVAMLVITVICAVAMRAAHRSPLFWTVAVALVAGLTYSAVKAILAKMVLDANKMTMTIYNPSAKCYKFSDVNYVDSGTVNDRNGEEVFIVTVYMGDGRRSIDVATYSKEQAKEVERLMCAMFSSGVSSLISANEYVKNKFFKNSPKKHMVIFTLIIILLGWVLSLFGFANLVGTVYPICGYFGFIVLVFLLTKLFKLKRSDFRDNKCACKD